MEAALVAVVVGWFLGIGSQFVGNWFERKRRREEREEAAAKELLGLLDQARALFRNAYRHDSEIDDERLWQLVGEVRQKSVLLNNSGRERLDHVANVFGDYWGAMQFTYGGPPSKIAFHAWTEGRESLRRILRGEALAPMSKEFDECRSSIEEYRALEEARMQEESERRSNKVD